MCSATPTRPNGIRLAANGKVEKFNDLLGILRGNVDAIHKPLTAKQGEHSIWTERVIDDVAAFIATLDEDYPFNENLFFRARP